MAIIKTYPLKNNYYGPDRLILSDMQPDDQGVVHGTTKSLTLSNLKSFIGGGAATLQLTTTGTSGAATFDVNTNTLNVPVYEGDTYTLQAEAKSGISVPLKLDAATGSDSTVNLKEGANITLTRNSATEITISGTGGGSGVSSITNAFGTYITGTTNTAATGAVGLGTINLNAIDGTSIATTRFLSKDNTWDVISASGSNTQFQYNNSGAFAGTPLMVITGNDEIQIGQQTNEQGKLIVSGQAAGTSGLIKIEGKSARGVTFSVQPETNVNYNVVFPDTGPGGNNKILESSSSGELAWIDTPTGINVVGNPSGTASVDLSKITIGSTIYAIPTGTNTTYSLGTGSTAGQIVLTGSNPSTSQTVTVAGTSGISITQFTSGTFNVNLDLATSSARGGIELFSNNTQTTAANSVTTTASRTYGIQLNAANQAVVNVPWVGGGTTYTAGTGVTINSGNVISNTDLGSSQFIYKNFTGSTGGTATASSNNDTLTIAAGAGITTTRSGDTITVASTGSGGYDDGFIPLDIYQATSPIGGTDGNFSFIRQTQSYNSSTINRISFFVSSIGSSPEIRFALFDGANVKNGVGTCRVNAQSTSLTAGIINEMALTDGEGSTINYTCVPGKSLVLFFAIKNCIIAGAPALSDAGLGHQDESYVSLPTVDDPLSTTKTAIGTDPNNKIAACHFFKT